MMGGTGVKCRREVKVPISTDDVKIGAIGWINSVARSGLSYFLDMDMWTLRAEEFVKAKNAHFFPHPLNTACYSTSLLFFFFFFFFFFLLHIHVRMSFSRDILIWLHMQKKQPCCSYLPLCCLNMACIWRGTSQIMIIIIIYSFLPFPFINLFVWICVSSFGCMMFSLDPDKLLCYV